MNNISIIKEKCIGCGSCEQICSKKYINMNPTNEGFLYPVVSDSCIHCGLCLKACPTQNLDLHRNTPINVYALKNKNEVDIMESASGGAADIATSIILSEGGVVFGAAYDENFKVKHIRVDSLDDKYRLQSSKYVQSDIGHCYKDSKKALEEKKKVLFTGTPCQIAGLYSFLGKEYENLFTIDLICHGVPSPLFFKKYLEWQKEKLGEEIIYYNFRSKVGKGWGTQYLLKTKTKTKTKTLSLDKYGKHFMDGDCYRESCYQCEYANLHRVADITVGDFWGVLKSHPDFFSDKGVSSVFINTNKGNELFNEISKWSEIIPISLEDGLLKQGNLKNPAIRPKNREMIYKNISYDNYIDNLVSHTSIKAIIKSLIPRDLIIFFKSKL